MSLLSRFVSYGCGFIYIVFKLIDNRRRIMLDLTWCLNRVLSRAEMVSAWVPLKVLDVEGVSAANSSAGPGSEPDLSCCSGTKGSPPTSEWSRSEGRSSNLDAGKLRYLAAWTKCPASCGTAEVGFDFCKMCLCSWILTNSFEKFLGVSGWTFRSSPGGRNPVSSTWSSSTSSSSASWSASGVPCSSWLTETWKETENQLRHWMRKKRCVMTPTTPATHFSNVRHRKKVSRR